MKTTIFESLIVLLTLLYCGTAKAQHVMRVVLTADGTTPTSATAVPICGSGGARAVAGGTQGYNKPLIDAFGSEEAAMQCEGMKIVGPIDVNDVKLIRKMAGSNEDGEHTGKGSLKTLDLSDATFTSIIKDGSTEEEANRFLTHHPDTRVHTGTALPEWVFSCCANLETVTLTAAPVVSKYAFSGCTGLRLCTDLTSANTTITSVDDFAFDGCTSLDLADGTLPQHLTYIGNYAFRQNAITKVIIPATTTKIGIEAFISCTSMTSLAFGGSNTGLTPGLSIMNGAFEKCGNMQLADSEGRLPDRIENIYDRAFMNSGITSVILPSNPVLTGVPNEGKGTVGPLAFMGCEHLTTLTVPANITTLEDRLLQYCKALTTIHFAKPENITTIKQFAFCNNVSLQDQFAGKLTNVVTIGEGAFKDCLKLTDADVATLLSKVTTIARETYWNCASLTTVDLPATITAIDSGAFGADRNLRRLTVHSGSQIDAVWYSHNDNTGSTYKPSDDIFYEIPANQVQVVFADDAETSYMLYRSDIVKDGITYRNAFMQLLTKTLDEDATDYTAVAQRHADVVLHRTFKQGWNTLVLPFGTRRDDTKDTDGAALFKKALHTSASSADDDDAASGSTASFAIAAYRGLDVDEANTANSTFLFRQFVKSDYDSHTGLEEFEPLLVKMGADDITADGLYTFENVELNYDGDSRQEYTPTEAKARMGVKEYLEGAGTRYFDGSYDHDLNDRFLQCTYDDFYFTGTLHIQKGEATEGSAFIAPGDYIIQNTESGQNFVQCQAGKKYALKGFRGYFKQKPASTSATNATIGIRVMSRNGSATAIDAIDGEPISPAHAPIYSLSGQYMGTDSSVLTKGAYVRGGRKFIVR